MNGPRIARYLLVFASLALAAPAWSMGLLVPNDGSGPLAIESHRVTIDVNDNLATTHIDQVFRNSSGRVMEATFIFPVPDNATVHDFALWMNGERVPGEILESTQARQVYESIVRQVRDPGLVEYVDGRIFQASIFPVPANGTQRVELEFAQVLDLEGELHRLVYPLRTGRTSATTLADFTLSADINSSMPIRAVYSPTHEIDIVRESENHAVVGLEQGNADLERDFVLYLSASDEEVGVTLFTFDEDGEDGEDGYFLMLVSPRLERDDMIAAKDVTFVVDTSGSMAGEKLEQAQETLRYCIGQLGEGDRFNVVRFSTAVRTLFDDLTPATAESRDRAEHFIERMRAVGGTAIESALDTAMAQSTEEGRPHFVIFITDGLPTVGETDADTLLAQVEERNPGTRVFSFGVGFDVDTTLLDRLSDLNGGLSDYVRPTEDIEVKVSNLYDRIAHPVLTDLEIDFGDANVDDIYPPEIPDLFAGNQVVVAGRYENAIESQITMSGRVAENARTYAFRERFGTEGGDGESPHDFIPQLWATRKIGFLIDQIRLNGENPELAEAVRTLGLRYGLVTPYTSYLAVDDSEFNRPPVDPWMGDDLSARGGWEEEPALERAAPRSSRSGWGLGGGGGGGGDSVEGFGRAPTTAAPVPMASPDAPLDFGGESGEIAVESSLEARRLREQSFNDRRMNVQNVGHRVLELESDGVWRQREVHDNARADRIEVRYLSNAYFDLVSESDDEVRRLMSLGERVEILWSDDLVVEINATGADEMTDTMREALDFD